MPYQPDAQRYHTMTYHRCGNSGLKLPAISLGLWHNFGQNTPYAQSQKLIHRAFDLGITHFDLGNNYGPPPGAAEQRLGEILKQDFLGLRDELLIATKAGYTMWDGPYGDWGSRKYLISSLDQSLRRLGLDYVDIFYHHRPDPETPLEETMQALDSTVRQGKALYVGLSNYPAELAERAFCLLRELGTPCIIHQTKYSMFVRQPEQALLPMLTQRRVGCIAFSPLAGGLLTDRYLNDIPEDSRIASGSRFLTADRLTPQVVAQIRRLNELALQRGQKLSQMALSWLFRNGDITSALIGASHIEQLDDAVAALAHNAFSPKEREEIDHILQTA